MIGNLNHILVMLDHDHGVSFVPESLEHPIESVYITGMQSGTGFIKNIHHIRKTAVQMPYHFYALRFAAGQG
ncbi:hypothetical protein D1872_265180 [compost metagenome]